MSLRRPEASSTGIEPQVCGAAADVLCMTPYDAVPQPGQTREQPRAKPQPPIALRLSEAEREALDAHARANDLTRSQVVRKAIRRLLAEDDTGSVTPSAPR
jgi:hypothetical protein